MGSISFNHSWAVGDTKAIKRVDKSIRDHNASSLTKEANIFFGLNDLNTDKLRKAKMVYDGKEYDLSISVSRRTTAPYIGKVSWHTDFANLMKETSALGKNNDLVYLQFEKNQMMFII